MQFSGKIKANEFVISVECNPPSGGDLNSMYEEIENYYKLVDAVNVTDCPMAKIRISSIVACHLIQDKFGIETIFNFTCRDRNLIGLQAELLGAHAVNVKSILSITGDDPSHGDCPEASPVFDVDSIGLIKLAKKLNVGEENKNEFIVGTTANLDPDDKEKERTKLEKKIAAGADFIMTQPFYKSEVIENYKNWFPDISIPLIVGVLPLKSYKMASYLNEKVPGISIPEDVLNKFKSMGSKKEAKEYGIKLAKNLLNDIKDSISGIHIMPMGAKGVVEKIVNSIN